MVYGLHKALQAAGANATLDDLAARRLHQRYMQLSLFNVTNGGPYFPNILFNEFGAYGPPNLVVSYSAIVPNNTFAGQWNRTYNLMAYVNGSVSLLAPFNFQTGSIPRDAPVKYALNPATASAGGVIVILVAVLCAAATAVGLCVLIRHRGLQSVKASNLYSWCCLTAGLIISCILPLTYLEEPTLAICNLRMWSLYLGSCTMFAALIAKSYQLLRIFNTTRVGQKLSPYHVLMWTASMVSVALVLLVVGSALDASQPTRIEMSVLTYYTGCAHGHPIETALLAYNGLILFSAVVLATMTRHVYAAYNESKYIGLAIYNYAVVIALVMAVNLQDDMLARLSVFVQFALLYVVLSSWAILFYPVASNLRRALRQPEEKSKSEDLGLVTAPFMGQIVATASNKRNQSTNQTGTKTATASTGTARTNDTAATCASVEFDVLIMRIGWFTLRSRWTPATLLVTQQSNGHTVLALTEHSLTSNRGTHCMTKAHTQVRKQNGNTIVLAAGGQHDFVHFHSAAAMDRAMAMLSTAETDVAQNKS